MITFILWSSLFLPYNISMLIKNNRNFDHYGLTHTHHPHQVANRTLKPSNPLHSTRRSSKSVASARSSSSKKGIQLSRKFLKNFDRLYGQQIWQQKETNQQWCQQFFHKPQAEERKIDRKILTDVTNQKIKFNYTSSSMGDSRKSLVSPRVTWNHEPISVKQNIPDSGSVQRSQSHSASSFFSNFNVLAHESWSTEHSDRKLRNFESMEEYFRGSLIDSLKEELPNRKKN